MGEQTTFAGWMLEQERASFEADMSALQDERDFEEEDHIVDQHERWAEDVLAAW